MKRINLKISPELDECIEHEAIIFKTSKNKVINEIIESYLKKQEKQNDDEEFPMYDKILKEIRELNAKIEELGKLFIDYLMFYFRTEPGMPITNEDYQMLQKGTQSAIDFLQAHRNKIIKDSLPFMQTIFGNLLEEDSDF